MAERDGGGSGSAQGSAPRAAGGGKMSLHSLLCVKKHKLALSCNGVRDKTAFVSVNEFTDLNLLSDYRFLEDVSRTADAAARHCIVHSPATKRLLRFVERLLQRVEVGNCSTYVRGKLRTVFSDVLFMLSLRANCWAVQGRNESNPKRGSTRRILVLFAKFDVVKAYVPMLGNTQIRLTCDIEYLDNGRSLESRVCIQFVNSWVPDDKTLADILKPYIDPVESDPVVCQRLKIYTGSPQSDVQILMKIENRSRNSVRYNELDASRSLLDNLKGKVIIEYPTLFVVLKTLKNDMVVLGKDGSEPVENSDSESSSLSSMEEGEIRDSS
ncbi:zinc finger HIT-type containing 6 [Pitangus sulphuratus]|nr:zinc finger HIT-type containing 6 [Pitangus sulphuratus]